MVRTLRNRREKVPEPSLVVRPLCAEDVEGRFFHPSERRLANEWLAKQESGELYVAVAELDGVPVGRRCLDFKRFGEGIGYCFAASVSTQWRSQGIGSKIDRHLERVARERGLHTLRSMAAKDNERAVRWHEMQGDRRTGERIERYISGVHGREVVVDCWMFERPL